LCLWAGDVTVADPAVGSAGVSGRQSRFDGSDRQARGRLLRALTEAPVDVDDAARLMGLIDQPSRADRLVADLVAERLVVRTPSGLSLP
jgi:A/G-specific adenine glycosylase